MTENLVVGKIARPHGLKGAVEVVVITDNEERFAIGKRFILSPPIGLLNEIEITSIKAKKDRLLLLFSGFSDRSAAEGLTGRELLIPETEALKPPGTYWHHEIIGCRVLTIDGAELGHITDIVRTGETDVYVVGGQREYYIPATKEVVKEVDISKKLITIVPVPGLLEL